MYVSTVHTLQTHVYKYIFGENIHQEYTHKYFGLWRQTHRDGVIKISFTFSKTLHREIKSLGRWILICFSDFVSVYFAHVAA